MLILVSSIMPPDVLYFLENFGTFILGELVLIIWDVRILNRNLRYCPVYVACLLSLGKKLMFLLI